LVSGFRETEAYIQAPEKQSLVEDFSWKAPSLTIQALALRTAERMAGN
jgi:hypothetical protein